MTIQKPTTVFLLYNEKPTTQNHEWSVFHLDCVVDFSLDKSKGKAQVLEYWKTDAEYYSFVTERSSEIARFQELTLQHGIDNIKFNIEWFKNLRQQGDIK